MPSLHLTQWPTPNRPLLRQTAGVTIILMSIALLPITVTAAPTTAPASTPAAATPGTEQAVQPPQAMGVHRFQFLRDGLPGAPGTNASAANQDIDSHGKDLAVEKAVEVLKAISPTSTITADQNRIVVQGKPGEVNKLKNLLSLALDVPSPQVKAELYTIQVNTKPRNRDQAQDKVDEIQRGVQIVHDYIQGTQATLNGWIAADTEIKKHLEERSTTAPYECPKDLLEWSGFDTNNRRPMSLNEMLIFLAFSDRAQFQRDLQKGGKLTAEFKKALERTRAQVTSDNNHSGRKSKNLPHLLDRLESALYRLEPTSATNDNPSYLFDRMAHLYGPDTSGLDASGISAFVRSWLRCAYAEQYGLNATDVSSYGDELSNRSAIADLLLKQAMDAASGDLQNVFYQPLLDWIREDVRGYHANNTGIDLVGQTTVTVRDRSIVESKGSALSYLKFTPITKLTPSDLTTAKTSSKPSAATPDSTTTHLAKDSTGIVLDHEKNPVVLKANEDIFTDSAGLAVRDKNQDPIKQTIVAPATTSASERSSTIFGAMTPEQQLLLNAVFASDVDPTYRSVTAGTDLSLRPFVVQGDGSARLQLNLTTNIDTTPPDAGSERTKGAPINLIKSHTVSTEATVSAFDLTTISSFGLQTTGPGDYGWRIPVLDMLPVVGALFHGPVLPQTTRQDSIVLVNVTIMPRSLDLVPFLNVPTDPKELGDFEQAIGYVRAPKAAKD